MVCLLSSCSKAKEEKVKIKEIPKDCIVSELSFDVTKSSTDDLINALNYFTQTGSKKLGLSAYMMSNNDIICTNDIDAKTTPYEELIYTTNEKERNLKYRYICFDNLDDFDFEYVKKQIKTVFGINLSEYDVEKNIEKLKESITKLEDNNVIPTYIDTGNDINLVIGGAKQNSRICISIVGEYTKTLDITD